MTENNCLQTPILFLIFNRPETTRRVFDEIRKAKPARLFIAADGPRKEQPDDAEKCAAARKVTKNIDWPCEVKTFFREKNLGCKISVSSAIDWFFENVDEGIILEDDCLPDKSFFSFCEYLLEYYRNEKKVMMVGGFNTKGKLDTEYSYIFSKFVHIWGWATWKRAWTKYDVEMKSWKEKNNKDEIRKIIGNRNQWKNRKWTYNKTFSGRKNTWDYQWEYACLINHGLCIIPSKNLVKNIGFDEKATHTKNLNAGMDIPSMEINFPLKHNLVLEANRKYDFLLFRTDNITKKIIKKIKNNMKQIKDNKFTRSIAVLKEKGMVLFIKYKIKGLERRVKKAYLFVSKKYIIKKLKEFTSSNINGYFDFITNKFFGVFAPMQIREEFLSLLKIFKEKRPLVALEIGTANGGTLFCFSKLAPENATIVSVDLPEGKFGGGYPFWKISLYQSFAKDSQDLHLLRENSHTPETLEKVEKILNGRPVDFLFIDGDHTYEGVKKDFEMYSPLVRKNGGVVAFHNIAIHPKESRCFVSDFWEKLCHENTNKCETIINNRDQGWAGIGVLFFN